MPFFLSAVIVIVFSFFFYRGFVASKDKLKFFAQGFDYGFHRKDISVLWKLAKQCQIEEPLDLFVSENAVNKCIAKVIEKAREDGEENSYNIQMFLDKLYRFKTRVVLDLDNKRGLDSTKSLDVGQRLSIILKGHGVFYSHVVSNGRELIVSLPVQRSKVSKKIEFLSGEDWKDKQISIYFWRKNDAAYAFDTEVFGSGNFRSDRVLFLKHSYKLERMQKRQSIRVPCEIYAQMFVIRENFNLGENTAPLYTDSGYKCFLEDISEDGAMIRIGGMGKNNVQIKIQFELNNALIIMSGVIRAVEFNENLNQSRLHFECTHIEQGMKNAILSYVYNVIPPEQKEINEAIAQAESFKDQENEKIAQSGEGEIANDVPYEIKPRPYEGENSDGSSMADEDKNNSAVRSSVQSTLEDNVENGYAGKEPDGEPSSAKVTISGNSKIKSENTAAAEIASLPVI